MADQDNGTINDKIEIRGYLDGADNIFLFDGEDGLANKAKKRVELEKKLKQKDYKFRKQADKILKNMSQIDESLTKLYTDEVKNFEVYWTKKIKAYWNKDMANPIKKKICEAEGSQEHTVVSPLTYLHCSRLWSHLFGLKYDIPIRLRKKWTKSDDDSKNEHYYRQLAMREIIDVNFNASEAYYKVKNFGQNIIDKGDTRCRFFTVMNDVKKNKYVKSKVEADLEMIDMTQIVYKRGKHPDKSPYLFYTGMEDIHEFLKRWKWKLKEEYPALSDDELKEFLTTLIVNNTSNSWYKDYAGMYQAYVNGDDCVKVCTAGGGGQIGAPIPNPPPQGQPPQKMMAYIDHSAFFESKRKINEYNFVVQEIYTKDTIVLRINGVTVADFKNFYTDYFGSKIRHPYARGLFNGNQFSVIGKSLPEILVSPQEIADLVQNAIADEIKRSIDPMRFLPTGTTFEGRQDGVLKYRKNAIIEGDVAPTPIDINSGGEQKMFNLINLNNVYATQMSGVTRYSGGIGYGVERSAKGADLQHGITDGVVKPVGDNITFLMNRIAKLSMIHFFEQYNKKKVSFDIQMKAPADESNIDPALPDEEKKKLSNGVKTVEVNFKDSMLDLNFEYEFVIESVSDYQRERELRSLIEVVNAFKDILFAQEIDPATGAPKKNGDAKELLDYLLCLAGVKDITMSDDVKDGLVNQLGRFGQQFGQQQQQGQVPPGGQQGQQLQQGVPVSGGLATQTPFGQGQQGVVTDGTSPVGQQLESLIPSLSGGSTDDQFDPTLI